MREFICKTSSLLLISVFLIFHFSNLKADTFGVGENQFTIDFTIVGNPGNAADTTGYGSVGYTYRIGTYAISQNQIDAATASGLLNVVAGVWSGDQPAAFMSWYESAAFVNWLNTSKGFQSAYNLSWTGSNWSLSDWTVADAGYDGSNPYRNSIAKYFLPSENEFYKAAYGNNGGNGYYLYPTASDTAPQPVDSGTNAGTAVFNRSFIQGPASVYAAGGLSSYGTMGQGGNIWEWNESPSDGYNNSLSRGRAIRGGAWFGGDSSTLQSSFRYITEAGVESGFAIGFRVASVADIIPEPSIYALFGIGAIGMLMAMRRKKNA